MERRCIITNTGATVPSWAVNDTAFQDIRKRLGASDTMPDRKGHLLRVDDKDLLRNYGSDTLLLPEHHHQKAGLDLVWQGGKTKFDGCNDKNCRIAVERLLLEGTGKGYGRVRLPDGDTEASGIAGAQHHPRSTGLIFAYCRGL